MPVRRPARRAGLFQKGSIKMLEILLIQYKDMFGVDFPLREMEGQAEIDVINIIYGCLQTNEEYRPGKPVKVYISEAPGSGKN